MKHITDQFQSFLADWRPGSDAALSPSNSMRFEKELRALLGQIFDDVNRRAEANMLKTGKLEGSHFAAMTRIRKELGA